MNKSKAIETEYKGYLFRSRLEARWAVFFDACGVDWDYEAEGYNVGENLKYLPDFVLHNVYYTNYGKYEDVYVEVKGDMNDKDAEKIKSFAAAGNRILVVGKIPDGSTGMSIVKYINREGKKIVKQEWPVEFNAENLNGQSYPVLMGIDSLGEFGFFAVDDESIELYNEMDGNKEPSSLLLLDFERTYSAYKRAKQARLENKHLDLLYRSIA